MGRDGLQVRSRSLADVSVFCLWDSSSCDEMEAPLGELY